MLHEETFKYILSFLVGKINCQLIGYTDNEKLFDKYKIVIRPSHFFDKDVFLTEKSLPNDSLDYVDNVPILFGSNKRTEIEHTIIIDADFIASSFYLLSRYEELFAKGDDFDIYGRFKSSASIIGRLGMHNRPLVDEYGRILRNILRLQGCNIEEPHGFSHVYLTHDADKLTQYRNFRGFCGGVLRTPRNISKIFQAIFCGPENDPLFTFDWLLTQDAKVPSAECITFVKAGIGGAPQDKPQYRLNSKDVKLLLDICAKHKCHIGLHTSYLSGQKQSEIKREKKRLELAINQPVTLNRYHFLRTCSPLDMQQLSDDGFTDDFTLGFADNVGFRVGTCRPYRWINCQSQQLTNITIHPLTIMDCTLSDSRYMNLSHDEAFKVSYELFSTIKDFNGEIVLLWHNTSVSSLANNYHRQLYEEIIVSLCDAIKL